MNGWIEMKYLKNIFYYIINSGELKVSINKKGEVLVMALGGTYSQ
jgi:hypothetical protein